MEMKNWRKNKDLRFMMKLKPWLSCFLVHCFLWSYWEDILFTQWFLHVSISLKGFFYWLGPSLPSVSVLHFFFTIFFLCWVWEWLIQVYKTWISCVLILQLTNFVIHFKEEYRIHSVWKCSCKEFCKLIINCLQILIVRWQIFLK